MIDSVERRRQIRIEHPPPAGSRPPDGAEDRRDRVVAATARPESVGSRLEPCLPLGFQRVDDPCLKAPVDDHGNTERALLSVLPFGMYTRLTGRACTVRPCAAPGRPIRSWPRGVNTTFPSTPAVLRPALSSVTRRTLSSVFARDRSINFCKLRTLLRSPACDAVKIRCRRRRTSSSTWPPVDRAQSRASSSGPFTTATTTDVAAARRHGVQLVLRFRCLRQCLHRLT